MPPMKSRSALVTVAIGLGAALSVMPAAAQYRNADAAIKYRQSAMSLQGNHMARLFAMANGQVPFDAKVAAEYEQNKALSSATYLEIDDVIDPADTRVELAQVLLGLQRPLPRRGKKRAMVDVW